MQADSQAVGSPSNPPHFDAVIFDWDGTLMDSTGVITESIRNAARDLGLPVPSREQASYVIGLGLQDALAHAVPGLRKDQLAEFVDRYRHHYIKFDATLVPFEGIPALLAQLHLYGVTLAVATGKSRVGLNRALAQTGWARFFADTRCADEGHPKPHPWMVHELCESLKLLPSQVVVVGDTTHDLGMARHAGASGIGVTYGAHDPESLAQFGAWRMVNSVAELSAVLLQHTRLPGR
jgi:phosphoglycolate phosphatase